MDELWEGSRDLEGIGKRLLKTPKTRVLKSEDVLGLESVTAQSRIPCHGLMG